MQRFQFRSVIAIVVASIALAVFTAFAQQQNPRQLFERARMLDESNQNLTEAIKLYGQVVKQAQEQRALAARAQLRVGLLYERLGRKAEAQRAFQAVVSQYAEQADVVRLAQAKLPASLQAKTKTSATGLTVRQVWAGPGVDTEGAVSPDGRYLSFVDWETGDLALRELATGKNHRLTNKGPFNQSSEFAGDSVISADGKQIAYAWFNKDNLYELRTIGMDGSNARVLYSNKETNFIQPFDWSPDGKHILAVRNQPDRTTWIVLFSVADGSFRTLKPLDGRYPRKMSFSPDGRYIAYDLPTREDVRTHDIFLLSADASREIPLVTHPAHDSVIGWTPDGKSLLFASDRTGGMSIWAIQVADGKAQGLPELVKRDVGRLDNSLGFTRDGAYFYGLRPGLIDVYTAELDPASGKLLSPPAQLGERFIGSNGKPVWSPDGQYLAYISERGPVRNVLRTIVIRSVKTGEERDVPAKQYLDTRYVQWFPDNRTLFVPGLDSKKKLVAFYRIDSQTGEASLLIQGGDGRAALAPDGETVFYQLRDADSKHARIMARELRTQQDKEIYRLPTPQGWFMHLAVSPDGRHLAFFESDGNVNVRLKTMPISGGEPRELLRGEQGKEIFGGAGIAWEPDGQHLLIVKGGVLNPKRELCRIATASGQLQSLGIAMEGLELPTIHPDGRRIAFSAGTPKFEVWVMENFLPAAQSQKASVSRR